MMEDIISGSPEKMCIRDSPKAELKAENVDALVKGSVNLEKHIENLHLYGIPVVVAINRFDTDTDAELEALREICEKNGADFTLSEVFAKGSEGGIELAEKVVAACDKKSELDVYKRQA